MTSAQRGTSASTTEALAATIAAAVERQLTQYVSAMAQQVDAARAAVDETRDELRGEFHASQVAMQEAIEAKLGQLGEQQAARMAALEAAVVTGGVSGGSIDAGELVALREHMDAQSAAAHARIDDLQRSARRFDEQTSALVQHVNDTTIALSQRMDEGNQGLATAIEERLGLVRGALEMVGPEVQRQIGEHAQLLTQRFDFTESKITDRMLAMEERVNEQSGTKIAKLEATIGRIGAGFDESMVALSQRMLELENQVHEAVLQVNVIGQKVNTVDEEAINKVKEQLSAAVGEVMLVRIELDRVVANTDDKVDKANLRMAEIESLLTDQMDVTAAVQLERLDELERAVAILDPNRSAHASAATGGQPGSAPLGSAPIPGLSGVPPLPGAASAAPGGQSPPQTLSSF